MESELEKKLFDKHLKIFGQKDLPMSQTCMCWGIDCGDGWYWIMDMLCGTIQSYCDNRNDGVRIRQKERNKITRWYKFWYKVKRFFHIGKRNYLLDMGNEDEWQVEATQVKEKYGGLRFYISGADDEVYGMISLAEHMSYHTCEYCGTTENVKVRSDGWVRTLCDKCEEKREEERNRSRK